jgi:hypothetical protein
LYNLSYKLKQIVIAAISISSNLLLDDALERIVEETCQCIKNNNKLKGLEADKTSVFIYDPDKEELWTKAAKS